MVEGTGLENRHTGEPGIESSNLSLSVLLSWRPRFSRRMIRACTTELTRAENCLRMRDKDVGTGGRVV